MALISVRHLPALLAGALLAAPLAAQDPGSVASSQSGVAATATGEVKSAPDRATILFSVETRAATAAEASAQNAEQQQAVLRALRAAGLGENDVGTVSYTIMPNNEYDQASGTSRVVGYIARNTVRAEVRDLASMGRVIDAAIQAGANEVSSLQFATSRAEQLRLDAIRSAMGQACREASALAAAAGGSLGPLLFASTSEGSPYPPPVPMMRLEAARAADTPITPQDVTVSVTVATRWQFVPTGVAAPAGSPTCR